MSMSSMFEHPAHTFIESTVHLAEVHPSINILKLSGEEVSCYASTYSISDLRKHIVSTCEESAGSIDIKHLVL